MNYLAGIRGTDNTERTLAAILSLTQYEMANHRNDMRVAQERLLDAMRHVAAIIGQIPDKPGYRPPYDLGRPDRECRYIRCMGYLTDMLPVSGRDNLIHNRVDLIWLECVGICEHHGWVPPRTLEGMLTPLAQLQPERTAIVMARPLLPRR